MFTPKENKCRQIGMGTASSTGFNELVPQPLLKSFDERELELVIGGLGKIDLEDWRTNTRLKHCQPDTPQVEIVNVLFYPKVFVKDNTVRIRLLNEF
jgi:E3 ubiquitin ligase SMURF1/2